jgi:Mala s 1-like protein
MKTSTAFYLIPLLAPLIAAAQDVPATQPAVLPGNGLAQHDFLYAGEFETRKDVQTLWVVKGGKVVWSYGIPSKDASGTSQELDDATMLPNGNILFSHKTGASEITPDKQIIWNYAAEPGTEVHIVEPMGGDRVMVVQNGDPAKLMVINTATNAIEKQFTLPAGKPKSPHGQFRRVRVTAAGTFLAAHMDMGKVSEYDANGKEIWTVKAPGAWDAERLANGNTLISCQTRGVREVDPTGKIVWQFTQKDSPKIRLFILQDARRLANGNTVITSWCPLSVKDPKNWPGTVQVLEVTPDKQIVWALSSWTDPADLGPASGIQILDQQ